MTAGPPCRGSMEILTHDGERLHTEIVAPPTGSAPVVLIRTPYGTEALRAEAAGWARHGYAVALQDVRGRYASTGEWRPYQNESADGSRTVEALRAAPWCDGRVICHGTSYGAHCALAAAAARAGAVSAVITAVPALGLRRVAREHSGTPRLYGHSWWWFQHGDGSASSPCTIHDITARHPGPFATLPVLDIARASGIDTSTWDIAWRHDGVPDSTADPADPPGPIPPEPAPPVLVIGGLHDVFRDDAVDLAGHWPSRADLIVGAWQHDLGLIHRDGNGALRRAAGHRINVGRLMISWLDEVLTRSGASAGSTRSYALEGSEQWATPDSARPPADWTLHPVRATFDADPDDPHPSALGPVEVSTLARRHDLARFITDPLSCDVDVVGNPVLHLGGLTARTPAGVRIDGPVDWAVRLALHPAGADAHHPSAMVQLAHAHARTAETSTRMKLPLLAHRLPPGSRLEVQVSAHQFPVYARDPQDGSEPLTAVRLHRARRAVGAARLVLPYGRVTDPPIPVPRHGARP